jgi:hypothetical protein
MAKSLIPKSHKGLLHKELGIKQGKKIGEARLEKAKATAKRTHNTTLEKRVVFAENFGHKHDPGGEHLPVEHTSKHH